MEHRVCACSDGNLLCGHLQDNLNATYAISNELSNQLRNTLLTETEKNRLQKELRCNRQQMKDIIAKYRKQNAYFNDAPFEPQTGPSVRQIMFMTWFVGLSLYCFLIR